MLLQLYSRINICVGYFCGFFFQFSININKGGWDICHGCGWEEVRHLSNLFRVLVLSLVFRQRKKMIDLDKKNHCPQNFLPYRIMKKTGVTHSLPPLSPTTFPPPPKKTKQKQKQKKTEEKYLCQFEQIDGKQERECNLW